uniref:YqaJ viral recombinase domain-containing protein n=1 Tax=Amphimedon queenslandica TaxID=400682 RepID=A0A1X7VSI0_AMPQE
MLTALCNGSRKCAVFLLLPVIPGFCETDSSTIGDVPEPNDINLLRQLFHLYNPAHTHLQPIEFQKLLTETFDNLVITEHQSNILQKNKFPKSLVSTIMQYSGPIPDIPALKWGRSHKDEAFKKYGCDMKGHVNFKIHKSCLFINPSYHYLGASLDVI